MADEEHEHVVPVATYLAVLVALMVLLALTLTAAFFDFDRTLHLPYASMGIAVLIAMAKATLIILFFMHVKYQNKVIWAFATAAFFWLGILLTLSLTDYLTRNNPPDSPKSRQEMPHSNELRPAPRHDSVVPGASAAPLRPPLKLELDRPHRVTLVWADPHPTPHESGPM